MNVSDILARFERNTVNRFKAGSRTPHEYAREFGRFARASNLEALTRRQVAGKRGREMLLAHMNTIPLRARRFVLAALECVWTQGMELPWPIDRKRDFGKTLPPIGRRKTPPDAVVRPWIEAVRHEADSYLKCLVTLILQYGWRPANQLAKIRRAHIRFDDAGRPTAFVADGTDSGFKTHSPIVAWMPPDVAETVKKQLSETPGNPDDPLLPWRSSVSARNPAPGRILDEDVLARLWRTFERKHNLPHLSPVYFRHWVKTACRRMGLSDPAMAAWSGHNPPNDGSMRNLYDNPDIEAILDEQSSVMPNGPLGLLIPPEVRLSEDLPPAAADLMARFVRGEIGSFELASQAESLRHKPALKVSP